MPRNPTDSDRVVIIGRTGSGKSVFACHFLSSRNFTSMPWVIIDIKGDNLIQTICNQNRIKELDIKAKPPRKAGLYILRPRPIIDDEVLEAWLMQCWAQENIGLYIDEGYALPKFGKTPGFTLILTQGRSKHIPVVALYQRPVWMTTFATAQADFFAVFEQNIETDLRKTSEFIKPAILANGVKISIYDPLPRYHCLWYDVSEGQTSVLRPAPDRETILKAFRERLNTAQSHRTFV